MCRSGALRPGGTPESGMSGQSSVRTLALASEDAGLSTRQGDTLIKWHKNGVLSRN